MMAWLVNIHCLEKNLYINIHHSFYIPFSEENDNLWIITVKHFDIQLVMDLIQCLLKLRDTPIVLNGCWIRPCIVKDSKVLYKQYPEIASTAEVQLFLA